MTLDPGEEPLATARREFEPEVSMPSADAEVIRSQRVAEEGSRHVIWAASLADRKSVPPPSKRRDKSEVLEMPKQIMGYYSARQEKLLREFDRISTLIAAQLADRYGEELSKTLQTEARREYLKLIPEIPYIRGFRAKALNSFLLGTAQELAIYKAMKKHGKQAGEAWEICHQAIRLKLADIPRWKLWFLRRLMFSYLARRIVARRARQQRSFRFGDFEVEYLVGDGDEFDFGVNYLQCGNLNFVKRHGGEEFAPYVCMSDIVLGEVLEWGLVRTQTLADACSHCDFRFKKGTPTQISSKTPEVQGTIERIRNRKAEQGALPV